MDQKEEEKDIVEQKRNTDMENINSYNANKMTINTDKTEAMVTTYQCYHTLPVKDLTLD